MKDQGLELFAERSFRRGTVDLFVFQCVPVGEEIERGRPFATSVNFTRLKEDEVAPAPTMSLNDTAAQQLMDELWRCGVRPRDGTGSAGSLAATEKHLADMRSVAFGLLGQHGVKAP